MKTTDRKRRVLGWCLVACMILLYITQAVMKWGHVALGVVFLGLLTAHVAKYAKWLKASAKAFFNKKPKGQSKTKYLIVCGMIFAFTIVFLSGFISAYELAIEGEVSGGIHRIHNAFAIIGGLLTIPHLVTWVSKRRKNLGGRKRGLQSQ